MSEDRSYNGWTNYETWAVALWLDNEQESYFYWREKALECWENAPKYARMEMGICTREEAAKIDLADQLQQEICKKSPLQESSLYNDLLTTALDEVNWPEIAGNWLEDWIEAAEKEAKEAETEQDKEEHDKAEEEKEPEKWPVIFSYTRAQALADGVLLDVTETAKEAGILYPTALTAAVWEAFVRVPEKAEGQDERGRLWDILFVFHTAAKQSSPGTDALLFTLLENNDSTPKPVQLKSICGPGDSAEPVITIMLPEED